MAARARRGWACDAVTMDPPAGIRLAGSTPGVANAGTVRASAPSRPLWWTVHVDEDLIEDAPPARRSSIGLDGPLESRTLSMAKGEWRRCSGLSERQWRPTRPPPERSVERGRFGILQKERDVADAQAAILK
jgi:hypothetical protein